MTNGLVMVGPVGSWLAEKIQSQRVVSSVFFFMGPVCPRPMNGYLLGRMMINQGIWDTLSSDKAIYQCAITG